jgi:hypothetical protein
VGEPKREKSKGAIPVITQLNLFIDRHRGSIGSPIAGIYFSKSLGEAPETRCSGGKSDPARATSGKDSVVRLARVRRGPATNLHRPGVCDKVIQKILRHANVTTTMNIYVKPVSRETEEAMRTLESKCAATVLQARAENAPGARRCTGAYEENPAAGSS